MKRREFLHNVMMGSAAPFFMNGLNLTSLGKVHEQTLENDHILVVIQLNGGNDGLNTVVPIDQYELYKKHRKKLALPEKKLLEIPQNENIALHPSLSGFQNLFNEGKAGIIQDVGYPNPDFSHFRSMDIWNSASNSNEYINSGWVGRYLSLQHPDFPNNYPNNTHEDPLAIQVGSLMNTTLQGPVYPMGLTVSDPNFFYEVIAEQSGNPQSSLALKELQYLRQVANQSNAYGEVIKNASDRVNDHPTYPDSWLAYQLKTVAKMIRGGLKTKFYFVELGGFDTHDSQAEKNNPLKGEHARLLSELSEAVSVFLDDLRAAQKSKNVLAITYSEFGRRIRSNASNGTDHGAAAPMFYFGDQVNSVVLGDTPKLSSEHAEEDSVPMQYDFRSVYSTILQNWFCVDNAISNDVMLNSFQTLPFINSGACGGITSFNNEIPSINLKVFPNPTADFTTVSFKSKGGLNLVSIFNSKGQEVKKLAERIYQAGSYEILVNLSNFQSGLYFVRWQNRDLQKVIKLVKL